MTMSGGPSDVELIRTAEDDPGSRRLGRGPAVFLILGLILALAVAGGYLYLRRSRPAPPATVAAEAPQAVKVRQETAQLTLPPLDDTDGLVRKLVGELLSHPVVAAWLTTDRLIVNFVVVTNKIGEGQSPAAELKAIGPIAPFRVRTSQGGAVVDPSSYRRYDRYAQAVAALDARGAVRVYETLKPRVNEAHRNFGGTGDFNADVERAIVELLNVPVVDGAIPLKPAGIGYAYADPRLETMSAAQKQLFRMGPDNVRAVQGKLREIASLLLIPESRLPRPGALD
jgi:hypothetical protein